MIYMEILAEDGTGWRLSILRSWVHITGGTAEFKMPPFKPDHACRIVGLRLASLREDKSGYSTLFTFGMPHFAEVCGGTITFTGVTLTLANEAVLRQFLGL